MKYEIIKNAKKNYKIKFTKCFRSENIHIYLITLTFKKFNVHKKTNLIEISEYIMQCLSFRVVCIRMCNTSMSDIRQAHLCYSPHRGPHYEKLINQYNYDISLQSQPGKSQMRSIFIWSSTLFKNDFSGSGAVNV